MKRSYKIALAVVILVVFSSVDAEAQCAMCRRIVESNITDGTAAVGKNLNGAILYLMAIPYVILASLVYIFYKNIRAKKLEDDKVQA
jgi:high-affinity nickel permease